MRSNCDAVTPVQVLLWITVASARKGGGGADGAVNEVEVWREGVKYIPEHLSKEQDIPLQAGDRVRVKTPGDGGYGPALERDLDLIKEDKRLGRN